MTPAERVVAVLSGQLPDRVALFLLAQLHGARALGLTPRAYFARPEQVVEGQLRLLARFGHDCATGFQYAAAEHEAFGGEVIWHDEGPVTAGEPVLRRAEAILGLTPPRVAEVPALVRVLEATARLRERAGVPVLGVVVSPFSLPAMQLGLGRWFELLHEQPELAARLLAVNEEFCVAWGRAQLAAGAAALGYFDPLASPLMVEPALARRFALPALRRTLPRLGGPAVVFLAGAAGLTLVDDVAGAGAAGMSASAAEDLAALKARAAGRLVVVGNLNGVEMRRWDATRAEAEVRRVLAAGAPGGRFILCDQHGELPWQVPEEVLDAVAAAARRFGRYPDASAAPPRASD